ncbi:MAG: beta-galactosidase trimerization domain-containing protein, partial [Armatimonadota bacterium]
IVHDPVVLAYCPPSDLVSQFYSDLTSVQASKDAMRDILHEVSLRHWRIPMDQIAAGALDDGEYKVVLLPYHQAMSEKAAAALRRFVERGGYLIADLRPAITNEHGRPLERGLLDDVFGIERRQIEGPAAEEGEPTILADSGPMAVLSNWQGSLRADRAVTARPGADVRGTVGDVPICINNRFGEGRAVLLNFALDEYVAARASGSAGPIQDMFSSLYAEAGVRPTVRVTAGAGRSVDGLFMQRWRNGSMRIVGLDRNPIDPSRDGPAKITVRWPERGYVYDIRAHRLLGERDTVETTLAVKVPKLYAWLPYEIGDVTIDALPTVDAGRRLPVTVGLSAPEGDRAPQIVCLDVYGPDGTWRHYLRQRLRLDGPEAETHIALAYNAPPGTWRLTATEVISGKTTERAFEVEPPETPVEGGEA